MQIRLNVRYRSEEYSCLCFRCAVAESISGRLVYPEVDDFSSENDFREVFCKVCGQPVTQEAWRDS